VCIFFRAGVSSAPIFQIFDLNSKEATLEQTLKSWDAHERLPAIANF
jgi:hypothetical protein